MDDPVRILDIVGLQTVKSDRASRDRDAETRLDERNKPSAASLGLGFGVYIVRSFLKTFGLWKRTFFEVGQMQPIDLNNLVEPYMDTGLYLAVTRDNTSVIGTGKTMRDAMKQAAEHGYTEPVIMRAPSRKAMERSLHL
jgi:hypothetical protein